MIPTANRLLPHTLNLGPPAASVQLISAAQLISDKIQKYIRPGINL